jgi:hypothetical protein
MPSPDDAFCGVPEEFALALTWGWVAGMLEFRFRHAKDEKAMLLRLSDWLAESEANSIALAEWMQKYERSFEAAE